MPKRQTNTASFKEASVGVMKSASAHPYTTAIVIIGGGILAVVGLYELSKYIPSTTASGQNPNNTSQGNTSTPISVLPQQNPSTATSVTPSTKQLATLSGYSAPHINPSSSLSSGYVGGNLNYSNYAPTYAPTTITNTSSNYSTTSVYAPNNSKYNQQTLTYTYAPNNSKSYNYTPTYKSNASSIVGYSSANSNTQYGNSNMSLLNLLNNMFPQSNASTNTASTPASSNTKTNTKTNNSTLTTNTLSNNAISSFFKKPF
ncbi:MAG: hypothetical protein QXU98_04200 [Candidatus Parvarchaeota archaeon]